MEAENSINSCCLDSHHLVDQFNLFSSDSITIIASFLNVFDWFSMSGVNQCWFQAIHSGMKNEWKRIYTQEWKLDRILLSDLLLVDDENNNQHCYHGGDCGGDGTQSQEVDWMKLIQYHLMRLPIKIESVERGECLDFCEDRNKRMEWESPILKSRKGDDRNSFSIFQFSFNILKRLEQTIENFTSLDDNLEQIQQELFKYYRICLFLEYLSLGMRPSMIKDIVYIWEDIYDLEPILTLPLVSFLLLLLSDNPIELVDELIMENTGEVSNWIYISLSQCPQNRIGFSFILKELDMTSYSYDWNGSFPWYHQTDINDKNFPLYLGYSQHLLDDEAIYNDDSSSPCRVYHLSISCELLETHHVKLYREENILNY